MNNLYGDFQTPPELAGIITKYLYDQGVRPDVILEPTCGTGNFLKASAKFFEPTRMAGMDLQPEYINELNQYPFPMPVQRETRDIFQVTLSALFELQPSENLLILGNPPWVTNAQMKSLQADNLPEKVNLKKLTGWNALTGASNFDICEYIWIKLILEFKDYPARIALLCKTSVARNVFQYLFKNKIAYHEAEFIKTDVKKWFNVSADAGLFVLSFSPLQNNTSSYRLKFYSQIEQPALESEIGFDPSGNFISDCDTYARLKHLEGTSDYQWRQGVKHDAASVAELVRSDDRWFNKLGEEVKIEESYIFPFVKSADVYNGREPVKGVILPGRKLNEDVSFLQQTAPLLWAYLNEHREYFSRRQSSIYRTAPDFAYFGIGDYTFAPYKVVIAGLYKQPVFRLYGDCVIPDDTCYFLSFNDKTEAETIFRYLNQPEVLAFIKALLFTDAKRPITKSLLQRIRLSDKKKVSVLSLFGNA